MQPLNVLHTGTKPRVARQKRHWRQVDRRIMLDWCCKCTAGRPSVSETQVANNSPSPGVVFGPWNRPTVTNVHG